MENNDYYSISIDNYWPTWVISSTVVFSWNACEIISMFCLQHLIRYFCLCHRHDVCSLSLSLSWCLFAKMMIIIMFTIFTIMIIVQNLFSRDDWCICDEGEVNPNKKKPPHYYYRKHCHCHEIILNSLFPYLRLAISSRRGSDLG